MSGDPVVLVVTKPDDITADLVVGELNERDVPVARLDPGDFPGALTLAACPDANGLGGTVRTSSREVVLGEVRSVYWRRPNACAAPAGLSEQDAHWCVEQGRYGLGGVLAALPDAFYVNHPWRNRDAEHKPAQLAAAARSGLRVLPTLITNDPGKARRFASEYGPVVYKPVWNSDYAGADGRGLTVWVEEVTPEAMSDGGIALTAHMFQRRLNKAADVRLTAVGEELLAVRIDGAPGLDWRQYYESLSYAVIDPPADVVKGVRAYLDAFGLTFGAFDFGLDSDGRWWFYECNPNGQWAWFPDPITRRIVHTLADRLQHGSESGKCHDH
ncbi:ATP-grasp ribosomal peptide maturase [Streptomyces sp. CAU 1734]|uniref:ATP-grasp ribosomal peptide maturase n=1 Tax=Streptomyces sp. CAU 1734 TaxID=3140360 RepID=UPI00326196FE